MEQGENSKQRHSYFMSLGQGEAGLGTKKCSNGSGSASPGFIEQLWGEKKSPLSPKKLFLLSA